MSDSSLGFAPDCTGSAQHSAGAGRPTVNRDRDAEIIRIRCGGIGPREIARRLGLSPNVVSGVLSRAGLTQPRPEARPLPPSHGPKLARRNAEIVRLRKLNWAPCDIARLLKLTPNVVGSVLYRAGLSDPARNTRRPDFTTPEDTREAIRLRVRLAWQRPDYRLQQLVRRQGAARAAPLLAADPGSPA